MTLLWQMKSANNSNFNGSFIWLKHTGKPPRLSVVVAVGQKRCCRSENRGGSFLWIICLWAFFELLIFFLEKKLVCLRFLVTLMVWDKMSLWCLHTENGDIDSFNLKPMWFLHKAHISRKIVKMYVLIAVVDRTEYRIYSVLFGIRFSLVWYFPEIPNRIISGHRSKE